MAGSTTLSSNGNRFSTLLAQINPKVFLGDFSVARPPVTIDILAEDLLNNLAGSLSSLDPPANRKDILKDIGDILNPPVNFAIKSISDLPGITSPQVEALNKLGIKRIRDLLNYLPIKNARFLLTSRFDQIGESYLKELIEDNVIRPDISRDEIAELGIKAMDGIGDKTEEYWSVFKITTIRELAEFEYFKKALELIRAKSPIPVISPINPQNKLKAKLEEEGLTAEIARVTEKFNTSSLDPTSKFILSFEPIYVFTLYRAVFGEKVRDEEGIFNRVCVGINKVKEYINPLLLISVIEQEKIDIQDESTLLKLRNIISKQDFPYTQGEVKKAVVNSIQGLSEVGVIPDLVDTFLSKGELKTLTSRDRGKIKDFMVKYLAKLGLTPTDFVPGAPDIPGVDPTAKYDEYLALAYDFALKHRTDTGDPVKNVFGNSINTFNYQVDYFESIEKQAIDPENILAAGTLYYIKVLADDLGIFRITDSILMAWTSGRLDFPHFEQESSEIPTRLYNYYKLREHRTTLEEREMFYKLVLNVGDGQVMDHMAVNTNFTRLWDTLMGEVVRYIEKFEKSEEPGLVSKSGVKQAIITLQHNLSRHTSGMVKALLPEMYAHLENAIEILNDPQIVSQFGQGYHRNLWTVIERVSQEQYQYIPDISALRTSAVKAHQIFSDIARFDEATFSKNEFQNFVNNIEAFIIAQSQLANGERHTDGGFAEEEEDIADFETMDEDWDF